MTDIVEFFAHFRNIFFRVNTVHIEVQFATANKHTSLNDLIIV